MSPTRSPRSSAAPPVMTMPLAERSKAPAVIRGRHTSLSGSSSSSDASMGSPVERSVTGRTSVGSAAATVLEPMIPCTHRSRGGLDPGERGRHPLRVGVGASSWLAASARSNESNTPARATRIVKCCRTRRPPHRRRTGRGFGDSRTSAGGAVARLWALLRRRNGLQVVDRAGRSRIDSRRITVDVFRVAATLRDFRISFEPAARGRPARELAP